MNCSTCRYSKPIGDKTQCRRFPPPFPVIETSCWCGEYVAKEEKLKNAYRKN